MIFWQNHTAGRLYSGLLWPLGALCGITMTTILARVFAPEASLWAAVLCATATALLLRAAATRASTVTPPSLPAKAKDHFNITQDLQSAFDNREIRSYFQPQVSLSDGQITGMEALARWHHPSHGMVAPLTF